MKFWWLSFADTQRPVGEQFIGGAIVRATHLMEAVQAAHYLGISPGGKVIGSAIPSNYHVPPQFVERLLNSDEIAEMGSLL